MALYMAIDVLYAALMLGTDLSYVREQLKGLTRAEVDLAAKAADCHPKTIKRLRTKSVETSSVTVSKLALWFRTREKRRDA